MAESVKALPEKYQEMIHVAEWDMRTLAGVKRFREIKAKSLPSIAMDDEIVYSSIIPGQEVLQQEILKRFQKKNTN
ncbi:MAG: hypothetical protein A2277_01770 [Desulfobacterales bacterium RIFOXYA12_FULL_46_15]|nr:MAG: hypothetical protein A2277_01770 [Desulfobacterales bacterium RIFOXYA12_FULL_46_15]